jgi:hypothetical protein
MVAGGYVKATTQSRKLYTVDISSVSSTTEYTVQIRSYSNSVSCWAAWFESGDTDGDGTEDDDPETPEESEPGEVKTLTYSINVEDTRRYCNHISGGFRSGYELSYVGQGLPDPVAGEEWNAMMVPIPEFSFSGTFKKLTAQMYLWTSDNNNHTFRWAVTTSRDNEDVYKTGAGAVTDANQLGQGVWTPPYSDAYQWFTFDLPCEGVESGVPLYLYLWRNNTIYGNIHVMKQVNITLQYLVE